MNYRTCYHSRRNGRTIYYRRRSSAEQLMKLMNFSNICVFILSITMFVGVLVVHASSTETEEIYAENVSNIETYGEVTVSKMIQTSEEINDMISEVHEEDLMQVLSNEESTELEVETFIEEIVEPMEVVEEISIEELIGQNTFEFNGDTFNGYDMPNKYYSGIDWSFEPYMDYQCITNKSSPAYSVSHSDNAYTDENGLRRYITGDDQFKIDGQDDYIVALGTYYKPKGECGSRYLIVTTTGMFTIITGDEKADKDTDDRNMFSLHADGTCAGIIEWIVDTSCLETTMKKAGTITAGPVEPLQGTITHIYRIN